MFVASIKFSFPAKYKQLIAHTSHTLIEFSCSSRRVSNFVTFVGVEICKCECVVRRRYSSLSFCTPTSFVARFARSKARLASRTVLKFENYPDKKRTRIRMNVSSHILSRSWRRLRRLSCGDIYYITIELLAKRNLC